MKKRMNLVNLGIVIVSLLVIAIPLITIYLVTKAPPDELLEVDTSGAQGEAFCGHTEPMMVQVLLTDRSAAGTSNELLALRLVKVDFVNRSVSSVYFPKELNLTILALADVGFDEIRLDEIYKVGMQTQDNDVAAATNLVAYALDDTFGVLPDHYVTLDLTRMAELIDAVGGVEVEIIQEYDATDAGLQHYYVGVMHMESEPALAYAKTTSPIARWDGLERQTQVLKGLRDAALKPANLQKAPDLLQTFRLAVTTDLSPELGMDLTCLAEAVTTERVVFYGVDSDLVEPKIDGSLAPQIDNIKALLLEAFGS